MTSNKVPVVRLDKTGVMRVGAAAVPLDAIVASRSKGGSINSILARFPSLTRDELHAALDFHAARGADIVPRGPQQRDAHWQRWNATMEEDLGTDTPPNKPIRADASHNAPEEREKIVPSLAAPQSGQERKARSRKRL